MRETIAPQPEPVRASTARVGGGMLLGLGVAVQAAGFAVVVAVVLAAVIADPGNIAGELRIGLGWLVALTLLATALASAALPVLVRHAQETDALDETERRRWLIRLALWGPATMPVYWRRYVRPGAPRPPR